jgi:hypothetical protein
VLLTLAISSKAVAQSPASDEGLSRISRLEAWLSAIAAHRPGAYDASVRAVSTWNKEQLRLVWIDASTIVSLVREPQVNIFFITEPTSRNRNSIPRQVSPLVPNRSTQVLYTIGELRRLRELAKEVGARNTPGPENDVLKRGAMLHADIEILSPLGSRPVSNRVRAGPGSSLLLMDDGKQLGLQDTISHWDMGRRLLDLVRPPDSKKGVKTTPDPGADDTVRRWYLAGCAYMSRIRRNDPSQFARALELFPDDPDILFFAAAAHEAFAGVRIQSVMQSMSIPREITFDVQSQGAELRRAEQLYKRALERNPHLVEARIRLGRVLGLRGRHDEAIAQLKQGLPATDPVLVYYANLFLGGEFAAIGNVAEARRSYERAVAIQPLAQSPLFGLSRVADQAGDRAAALQIVARMMKLPQNERERSDPWWVYEIVQARGVDGLLADVRQRIATLPT